MRTKFRVHVAGVLLLLALPGLAWASSIAPISLKDLERRTPLVIIGVVLETKEMSKDPRFGNQRVRVRVDAVLKGKLVRKQIFVYMGWKGLKDFDPKLKKRSAVVLFLRPVKGETGKLAYRGAVAVFPKPHIGSK